VTDTPPLVLSGSPHRWGLVAFGCGVLMLCGIAVGLSGHYVVVGWVIAAIFAWMLFVAMRQTRTSDHLLLHDGAFDIVHRDTTVSRDLASCSEFSVWRHGSISMVVFDHPLDDASPNAAANRALTGRTGSLPHRFGVNAEELAQLMNMARTRALGRTDPTPQGLDEPDLFDDGTAGS